MKAILTPVGSDGDVLPFVGAGVELARRGYDVVVIANDHFEPIVRHAGLQFAACGTSEQYRTLIFARSLVELRRAARETCEYISRDLHRVVAAYYSPGETVLVAHVLAWGTRIVQELHSAPLATLVLSPAALFSAREPPVYARLLAARAQGWLNRGIGWLMHAIAEHEAGGIVNPYRASLGLSPERLIQPRGHLVAMFPEWFGPKAPDWPGDLVLAGFPLQETGARDQDRGVEDFLLEGSAPIVFTSGTGLVHVRPIFNAAIDACQRLGRRGILLTRYLDQVPIDSLGAFGISRTWILVRSCLAQLPWSITAASGRAHGASPPAFLKSLCPTDSTNSTTWRASKVSALRPLRLGAA